VGVGFANNKNKSLIFLEFFVVLNQFLLSKVGMVHLCFSLVFGGKSIPLFCSCSPIPFGFSGRRRAACFHLLEA